MPRGPVPDTYKDILESKTLGHLATIGEDGLPQVNPVWFTWDGERLLIGVKGETVKLRNLRRDPHLAISFLDPEKSSRYLELRGEVIEFTRYTDLSFVNKLSRKYTGEDATWANPADERYKLTLRVDSGTAQG
jgi:PPOX class probable F420-dependent enzyme